MERTDDRLHLTGGGDAVSNHEDTLMARELLQALQEKDRQISTLLERLISASAAQPQSAPTFHVTTHFSHNISPFYGSEDAPSACEWIENVRRTSELHGWPAAYTLETAKTRLVGAANDWFHSRSSQIRSWEDFEVRFRRTFVRHGSRVCATGHDLLSTGSAAVEAGDAPSLQGPEVTPAATRKGHVNPFFKQVPPHVENSGDSEEATTKEGEEPQFNVSAGATEKPRDKDEAVAESKTKQTDSQPGAARKDSEAKGVNVEPGAAKRTAGKGDEQGEKKEDDEGVAQRQEATPMGKQEEGEVAEDENWNNQASQDDKGKNKEEDEEAVNGQKATDKDQQEDREVAQGRTPNKPSQDDETEGKGLEKLVRSAGEQTETKENEEPRTKPKADSKLTSKEREDTKEVENTETNPKEENKPKPAEPDNTENVGDAGANPKEESPKTDEKPKPEPADQASKPKSKTDDTGIVRGVAFLEVKPFKMARNYISLKVSRNSRANFCVP